MQVDDAFVRDVMAKVDEARYPIDIIGATLSVAAERGLVVPDVAMRMWATFCGDRMTQIYRSEDNARHLKMDDEIVVKVAIVEIKE